MNRGALKGFAPAIGDYQGGTASGGSWGGNRGRLHNDEFRAFGNADGQRNWQATSNARLINTNCQQGVATLSESVFPGDLGMVMNVGSGTFILNGASAPFAAAYNVAGKYKVSNVAGIQTAAFENNVISSNVSGTAQVLMGMLGLTSTVSYRADGAACTLVAGTPADIQSIPIFDTVNAGTLTGSFANVIAAGNIVGTGVTLTTRSGYMVNDINNSGPGTLTNQYGLDVPILLSAATQNSAIRIGQGGQTITATINSPGQIDVYQGTTILNFANAHVPPLINTNGTLSLSQTASGVGTYGLGILGLRPIITNTLGSTVTLGVVTGVYMAPTMTANTQTVASAAVTGMLFSPTVNTSNAGTVTTGTLIAFEAGGVVGSATGTCTIALYQGLYLVAPTVTAGGTNAITTWVGVDIAAMTAAGTNIGIRNASSLRQQGAFIATNNVVTVTSNAGTVAVTNYLSTFTNSSAATMAITMAVTGAVDGQKALVRIYDATNVAETIGWTNTENSSVVVPTTSNGSTTLPLTVAFIFNGSTSKWRCVGVS